jgi:lipopolysaccharide transport system ATP-binding protein
MSEIAIRAENVSKRYSIGAQRSLNDPMLQDAIAAVVAIPLRKLANLGRRMVGATVPDPVDTSPHTWALHDVSFEVPRGQIIGLIGPNGAGKSTLLKIISRITEPTDGRIEIQGRVGSMLEVGTGFHPELTGRENIYLSGAMLGMKKVDITRRLDEIIAFSGIEKFIDSPVKYYSSGMYVRLGFAVAAHLESEILLIDEVLAVGDVAFQRKCLAKMDDVQQHGRTVIFVSHSMPAVTRLCERAILIAGGVVQKDGPASQVASAYLLASASRSADHEWTDPSTAPGNEVIRLRRLRVRTEDGATTDAPEIHSVIGLEMVYDVLQPGLPLGPSFELSDPSDLCIFSTRDLEPAWRGIPRPAGRYVSTAWIPANFLAEGMHLVRARAICPDPLRLHFDVPNAVAFQVVDRMDGQGARGDWEGNVAGVVRPMLEWTTVLTK